MFRATSATAVILIFLTAYHFKTHPSTPAILTPFLSVSATRASTPPSLTAFVPFVPTSLTPNKTAWTNAVRIPWCLSEETYCSTGTLDTGSTGILLSAADLDSYNASLASTFPVGWQFLTSSKILYIGNWIPRNLTIPTNTTDTETTNITASIPILAVTKRIICPDYNITSDGPACRNATEEVDMPVHIVYFGVGFGRQYNGQLQGNPDKNPFLNIIAINGQPVSASQMHMGYIVTNQGVHVGLTEENSMGFEEGKVKLVRQTEYSDDERDWEQTGACIDVFQGNTTSETTSACVNGTILVDTGVAQMYLTIPSSIPVTRIKEESASRPGTNVSVLADNQTVSVQFGTSSSADYDLEDGNGESENGYSFVVGDETDQVGPTQVITTVSDTKSPFVNTGRHFLRKYDILFDARDGYFGVRTEKEGV